MNKCKSCGRGIKSHFERCFKCQQEYEERESYRRYREMTPQGREDELEAYYNTECDMCGKEGASARSDGRNYCGMCWQVWNS